MAHLARPSEGGHLARQSQLGVLIELLRQAIELLRQLVEQREGSNGWITACEYAKRHHLRADEPYLRKVGSYASGMMRARGQRPGRRRHPRYVYVNAYPPEVLFRAFAAIPG